MSNESNKQLVETLWQALSEMDWETLKGCLHPDVHYEDVATDDPGARGPENCVKRLSIAFSHLEKQEQIMHNVASDNGVVFVEHTEKWTFKSGEKAQHTFVTLHEIKDGKIALWRDYWDVQKFVGQFPEWFLEEMMKHSEQEFS